MASLKKTKSIYYDPSKKFRCVFCDASCDDDLEIENTKVECGREVKVGKSVYSCSDNCTIAYCRKDNIEYIQIHMKYWMQLYDVTKEYITHKISGGEKPKKDMILMCKTYKTLIDISDMIIKNDWYKAGILFKKSQEMFTNTGEYIITDLNQGNNYLNYLNYLEKLKQTGRACMNMYSTQLERTFNAQTEKLWL
jgi:hypothetical protein